jgi:hypothetical protein
VLAFTVVVGVALLLGGWRVEGYAQSLMLGVGVTILLAVPVVLVGQALSTQVEGVRDTAEAVAGKVDELRQQMGAPAAMTDLDDLAASIDRDLRRSDEETFSAYEAVPSWPNLAGILARAAQLDAIPASGVRVDLLTGSGDRLRVLRTPEVQSSGRRVLKLSLEDVGGVPIEMVDWEEGTPIDEPLASITLALQRSARYGGEAIRAQEVFARLGTAIRTAVEIRRTGAVPDLPALFEISGGGQWGLTTLGVQALDNGIYSYTMTYDRLHEEGFFRHVAAKGWVVKKDFEDAYYAATALTEAKADWFVATCLADD